MRRILSLLLSFVLLTVSAAPVSAVEEDAVLASGDVLVARPLGIVSAIIGSAIFLVALPFAATSGTVKETADVLIGEPMRFSFKRPVGDLSQGAGYGKRHASAQKKSPEAKAPAEQTSGDKQTPKDVPAEGKLPAAP